MSVRLVPVSGRHARELRSLVAGEPAPPWPSLPSLAGRDDVLGFLDRAQRLRAHRRQETFAVCEDDRLVGLGVLARDDRAPDHAELGYWVAAPYRGRGYATAAARQLVAHGFERMRLAVVFARAAGANRASVRVLDTVGLRLVGVEPAADGREPVGRWELTREAWLGPR
jgi:RimJ/RimL family protein N-acetyltransferase